MISVYGKTAIRSNVIRERVINNWTWNILPMAGLNTPMGSPLPVSLINDSASAFVNVYVFGHLPKILIENLMGKYNKLQS